MSILMIDAGARFGSISSVMRKRAFFLLSCGVLLLAGCRKAPEPSPSPVAYDPRPLKAAPRFEGRYEGYQEGIIGDGNLAVLFFYSGSDDLSRQYDGLLANWFTAGEFPVSMYRVDFDAAGELRELYGVEQPHTFVGIDGSGNVFSIVDDPSEKAIRELLVL